MTTSSTSTPVPAAEALRRLVDGNDRFVRNVRSVDVLSSQTRRAMLVEAQTPFAIILSCADSRVPSELVFDCGLGDLFVVRVAGNVVAPSLVGSIEFAAATFKTRLVAVVGHSQCGAVKATVESLKGGAASPSDNIKDIVSRISPAVRELDLKSPPSELLHKATRANVRVSVDHLRHGSALLEGLIGKGELSVVGGEYSLETGVVDFFDVPKELAQSIQATAVGE